MAKTKVDIRHDSLSIRADFENKEMFKFKVNRSGEKMEFSVGLAQSQINALKKICNFQPDESNGERIERINRLCKSVNSLHELASV